MPDFDMDAWDAARYEPPPVGDKDVAYSGPLLYAASNGERMEEFAQWATRVILAPELRRSGIDSGRFEVRFIRDGSVREPS